MIIRLSVIGSLTQSIGAIARVSLEMFARQMTRLRPQMLSGQIISGAIGRRSAEAAMMITGAIRKGIVRMIAGETD